MPQPNQQLPEDEQPSNPKWFAPTDTADLDEPFMGPDYQHRTHCAPCEEDQDAIVTRRLTELVTEDLNKLPTAEKMTVLQQLMSESDRRHTRAMERRNQEFSHRKQDRTLTFFFRIAYAILGVISLLLIFASLRGTLGEGGFSAELINSIAELLTNVVKIFSSPEPIKPL